MIRPLVQSHGYGIAYIVIEDAPFMDWVHIPSRQTHPVAHSLRASNVMVLFDTRCGGGDMTLTCSLAVP